MRKLILALFIFSLTASGLYFAQKSSAAVVTSLAPAGTPLGAQTNYTWRYPITPGCDQLSAGAVPFIAYKFTVTTSGSYVFTMNTSGFTGVVHIYQNSFDPNNQCLNQANPQNVNVFPQQIISASPLTVPLTNGLGSATWVVVFSAQNASDAGTFSASVSGPAAVTPFPADALSIYSQPASKSVSKGCTQTLAVFANGPLPQTFQWYEGISGDLAHSIIIEGANSHIYTTPPLESDKSYWLRVTAGSDHDDTQTIKFKVYNTVTTPFKGSLDTNQTWNLTPTLCHPSGNFVHYRAIHFRIPVNGTYKVHLDSTFGNYQIIAYAGSFDATQPCSNYAGGGAVNTDLSIFSAGGQDLIIVVSATSSSVLTGDFSGSIDSGNSCTLAETIEETLLISGNPLDKAVTPGNSASLVFAYTGGSNGNKTIQWYQGASGDTSQPIANATTTNYTTPALSQVNNQTTYYYYWARVDDPSSFTHADTGTAVVSVITAPITYSDVLSTCDDKYTQVNGPTTYYKIFPFKVSTDGTYTFTINAAGFTPAVALYQGYFFTVNPNINYYGPGGTQNLLASTNNYYLVITSTVANRTGSFTLTISGPALVVPSLRPQILTQPIGKDIFRDQTATMSVTTNSPVVSYQWYTGTCTDKTAVGSGVSSYTTPALTDYKDYWVKVSYGVMYVNSNIAQVRIKPQAITDGYIIDEDQTLTVAAPGILANDKKADSKTLHAIKTSESIFGSHTLADDGTLVYTPNANANGPDLIKYKASDGTFESNEENVAILVRSINDAPVLTGGVMNNHTFTEDSAGGILHLGGLTFGPGGGADEGSQQLTYKVTAVPPASVGNVLLADNTVVTANTTWTIAQIQGMQFKPAANGYGGPYPFTLTVTDNGNSYFGFDPKSMTQSLNITVTALADTPTVTTATTNEDTQTTSGLVLDRNAADGAEVGYFKIGQIKGGTVYKNDGVTQITNEQFITYAEGHAGLKFKPNANAFSPNTIFSFEVRASLTNQLDGIGGSAATATITVNPVAELPSVTGAATFVNLQTSSGLVITRNAADGTEIGFYKISSITNGTLYKADGVTQIAIGGTITAAEGAAGLKFTPAVYSTATGSFTVQGEANAAGSGLGPAATASITVTKYNTSTSISTTSPAPSATGQQVTVYYSVLNTSATTPAPEGDVIVTVSGGSETCTATAAAGSCTLTLTTVGNPRTITASYGGNSAFNSSAGTKTHVVNLCTQNTVVTSTADDGTPGTLRYIVANACAGSTITFDPTVFNPAQGPYVISLGTFGNISGNLVIDRNLTIKGPGANILTVRRFTGTHVLRFRIFNITSNATASISGLTIGNGYATSADGESPGIGGGILNAGTLTLQSCVITGNKAGLQVDTGGSGGGIYNTGSLTVINSTISSNDSLTIGGGMYLQTGSSTSIINSTISGNTAAGSGGGILVAGTATIVDSTIANNTATTSGGGLYGDAGTFTIGNSIVAGNTSPVGPDLTKFFGISNTNGHNLIGNNDGAGTTFPAGSANVNADLVGTASSPIIALLSPLADNGGATPTQVPLPGSPALDSGNNANLPADTFDVDGDSNTTEPLPLDQRGQARIANTTVDIGAAEVSYALAATSGAGQSTPINKSFATALSATVTESGRPRSGATVIFAAPEGSGASGTFNGNLTATATTDSNGVAVAPTFTANGTIGNYYVVASLGDTLPSVSFNLTNTEAAKADQSISFGSLPDKTVGDGDFIVSATASSGLTVSFAASGNCTISGNTVQLTSAGSCTVTASQGGDSNYNAAPDVSQTFAINPAGANVAYVESTGNCGVDKTPCFTSIQEAMTASGNEYTVNILGGTFNESIDLDSNVTVNVNGDTTVNGVTLGAGTLNGNGFTLTLSDGNWTKNGGTFNPGAGTVSFAGSGQTIGGSSPTTFNNLIVGAGGAVLNALQRANATNTVAGAVPVDTTITGVLTLNGDLTAIDPAKVIMTATATSAGTGDVVGNLQRLGFVSGACAGNSAPCANTLSVGNPNNQITITDGTAPSSILITLAKSAPASLPAAVQRSYTITPTGGNAITATLRLHYLDAELNGNTPEANLALRRFDGSSWVVVQPTQPVDNANNWVESNAVHDFSQWTFSTLAPTASEGLISGRILASDGTPVPGAVVRLSGAQTRKTITDAEGNYHFSNVESTGFYTVTPARVNYNFNPFNRSFSQLGNRTDAVFTAMFNGDTVNPLDTPEYFVRQQYVDVLSREPDESGFNFWSNRILECGSDALCVNARRRDIAAEFFIAQEFQQSGAFINNTYQVSFGRRPSFAEFSIDRQQVVGGSDLPAAKQAFAESFVQRPEFTAKHQSDTTAELFVDSLLANLRQTAGVELGSQREMLITYYQRGTNQVQSRSFVLGAVTGLPATRAAYYNSAFVLTEYFGYLRRDPDQAGYDFWLNTLNSSAGGGATTYPRMVCSFITSAEYQNRFSTVVSHSNGECGQ